MSAANNAFGFMARLSPRERTLLGVLLLVFFATAIGALFMLRSSSFVATREEIAALRSGIDLVQTRGQAYDTKKKEKEAREARIANAQPIIFSMLLEEAQKNLVTGQMRGEEEKTPFDAGNGLIKRAVGFEIRSVGLDELLNFLSKLEAQPGHIVFVERLAIKSPSSLEDRLNVEVELATWELQRIEEPPPAPAGEEEVPQ